MLIKNARIHTAVNEAPLEGHDLQTKDGLIVAMGQGLKPEAGERVIEAQGLELYPGFIDAHTHLGVSELGLGFEGQDTNETSSPLTPEMRGIDGCNPRDMAFERARAVGITTVAIGPGSANVLGGLFFSARTWGTVIDQMALEGPPAMKAAFGENPKRSFGLQGKAPKTRMAVAALLRGKLQAARNYQAQKKEAEAQGKAFAVDLGMEQLLLVLEKKIRLKTHAHRTDDILTAIRIAKEFDILLSLDHCTEGEFIVEAVKASGFPPIVGPSLNAPGKVEIRNKGFQTVAALTKAGIACAITTDHPVVGIELLPLCAGYAYKAGMTAYEALRAITIHPAEILGISDLQGSLELGKRANLSLYDGSFLSNLSDCLLTLGEGQVIHEDVELIRRSGRTLL